MTNYKFIGLKQRAVMQLLDLMIIAGISYLINSMMGHWQPTTSFESFLRNGLGYITPFIPGIYFLTFWIWIGATPGKLLRFCKIVDPITGRKPKFWKLLVRLICLPISNALLLLGIFWMGWDSRKQTWHDKMAGTVVIGPNTIKFPKDADANFPLPEFVPLLPALPTIRDKKWWIAGRILFVISIFAWIGIILYTTDTRLYKGAEKWLYEPAFVEDNPRDNGYYYLVGLAEKGDEASFQRGYDYVRENNKYVLQSVWGQNPEIPKTYFSNIEWDLSEFNGYLTSKSWLDYCTEYSDSLAYFHNKYEYVNDRINLINESKYFRSTTLPSAYSRVPILMDLVKKSVLEDSYAISLYIKGDKTKALEILKQNRETVIILGSKVNILLGKLALNFALQRNLEAYNELIGLEINPPNILKTEIMAIEPVPKEVYDMLIPAKRIFTEITSNLIDLFNFQEQIYYNDEFSLNTKQIAETSSIIFQPHRTINREYESAVFLIKLSRMSANKFAKNCHDHPILGSTFTDYFNNLFGTIMTEIAVPLYASYIAKLHNLDGYANLLKMKLMIKEQNIASENIPEFLVSQKDSLYNPYTEEAISWDAEQNELYFPGPFEGNAEKRELKVFE